MIVQRCFWVFLALSMWISNGVCADYALPARAPENFSALMARADSIVLVKSREFTLGQETTSFALDPIEALKGEIPPDMGNLVLPIRMRPSVGGYGTVPMHETVLVFLERDGQGNNILLPPASYQPRTPWNLFLSIGTGNEHVVPKEWCDSSISRRVICLGSAPLLREETSAEGMAFHLLTWSDGSEDLRYLWRALKERGGAGAGHALAQELSYSDEDVACAIPEVFAKVNHYERSSIRFAVDTHFHPLKRESFRCLGDLALDETIPDELRTAAAMAIQRMHVPAAAEQLVRLVESEDEKLRDIATFGLTMLAAGKPPVGRDVAGLPTRVWKLELPEELTETEQAMRRDTPALRVDGRTRGSFWVEWYYRHKERIDAQVEETEAQ